MNTKKPKALRPYIYIYILIAFLLITWTTTLNIVNPDEAFTLNLIHHSFKDVILLDAIDVHPPLYYLLLKLFFNITFINHCSPLVQIIAGRVFSLLITLLTLVILSKLLSAITHNKINLKFLMLLFLLPSVLYYSTNVRMYSLAALFITCEIYAIYKFNQSQHNKYLLMLMFWAICAAWTHYFAAVAAGLLILYNFINALHNKKIKNAGAYVLSGIALLIGFIPWAAISIKQIHSVDGSYWIKDNLFNYVGMFSYTRLNELIGTLLATIFAIIVIILTAIISYKAFKMNSNTILKKYYLMTLTVLVGTILLGFVLSLIVRPIFISRYAYPIFLVYLAFTLSLVIPYLKKIKPWNWLLGIVLGVGLLSNIGLGAYSIPKNYEIINTMNQIEKSNNKTFNDTKDKNVSLSIYYSYCLPNKQILVARSEAANTVQSPQLFKAVYPNIKFVK